jgi:multimeric flavodoxin WrbA
MKVLGIVGSPRQNGNTHLLVSRILDGAREKGANTETIFLGDLSIQECDGCHACWKGKHTCSKHDDMEALYPKIAECNAVVLGTPVYWFGPTALMKCFIDRFVYFNGPATRKMVKGKHAVIAVPFEDNKLDTAELVVDFFEKSFAYMEMKLSGEILAPGVTRRGEVRRHKRVMDRCYRLGQELATIGAAEAPDSR